VPLKTEPPRATVEVRIAQTSAKIFAAGKTT
jgi:hypothetical protein